MKNIKELLAHRVFKIFKWVIFILVGLFIILTISRIPHYFNSQKTQDQILKIHNAKLSIDDVMGKNLPRDPGEEADKTVQGIDLNFNGIRDDVELAIFKEYPNSAKTRMAFLQYSKVLQMETTQPFLNKEIVTKIINEEGRSDSCLSDTLVPRKTPESSRDNSEMDKIDEFIKFIELKQINTKARVESHLNFYEYLNTNGKLKETLYGYLNTKEESCDINLLDLLN